MSVPTTFNNGWLNELDGRTGIAQVMRARYEALTYDLGGNEKLSYQQRSIVERALWLEYWLADQEKKLAQGEDFDSNRWIQACNSLQGLYGKLGLHRVVQSQDIVEYLSGM